VRSFSEITIFADKKDDHNLLVKFTSLGRSKNQGNARFGGLSSVAGL